MMFFSTIDHLHQTMRPFLEKLEARLWMVDTFYVRNGSCENLDSKRQVRESDDTLASNCEL